MSSFILRHSSLAILLTISLLPSTLFAQGWQVLTSGLSGGASFGVGAGDGNTLFASFTNGVFRSDDNGLSWQAKNNGLADPFGGILTAVTFYKTAHGTLVRGGAVASWFNKAGSAVFTSSDNGETWMESSFPFSTPSRQIHGAVLFDDFIEHNGALYASDMLSHGVWKSTDQGVSWTASSSGIPFLPFQGYQSVLNIASAHGSLFAITAVYGVWRSDDNGTSWYEANEGIASRFEFLLGTVREGGDIRTTPAGELYALVGDFDFDLYWFNPSSSSWEQRGVVRGGHKLANIGETLYIGTGTRHFEVTNQGRQWVELPTIPNDGGELEIQGSSFYAHNGALYITKNNGLHRLDLASATRTPTPTVIGLSRPMEGNFYRNAGDDYTFPVVQPRGTGPFTYVWRRGKFGSGTSQILSQSSSDTLTLSNLQPTQSDTNDVWVEVTGSNGTGNAATNLMGTLVVSPGTLGSPNFQTRPMSGNGTVYSVDFSPQHGIAVGAHDQLGLFHLDGTPRVLSVERPHPNNEDIFSVLQLPDGKTLVGAVTKSVLQHSSGAVIRQRAGLIPGFPGHPKSFAAFIASAALRMVAFWSLVAWRGASVA